ncbi:hypothetical protein [Aurantiacibacter sp. D1-12]|uniref:hypothetical protein n=1 Tax=Aurantiacibacter sp. D1-12 TaxID=2993658 RepID=UPI00237CC40F|nr:hypothetical protein [Aurantiacibacter sp. D1-12]MDE1468618.1 hypothetical protein [Aurantiacibacter sp. D1-12]
MKSLLTLVVLIMSISSCEESSDRNNPKSATVMPDQRTSSGPIDIALIREFEENIRLPGRASDIGQYDRYYHVDGGYLEAVFHRRSESGGGIFFVGDSNELPRILDGGCAVINVRGSIDEPEAARVLCNGVA